MTSSSEKLGPFLAATRKSQKLSLRDVESETGISNAYLSQLETGKIREPSPINLHKLSKMYVVSYPLLLGLAGYPVPGKETKLAESSIAARLGPVTKEEEEDLAEYLQFLRSKRSRGGR
jgi:HTH-type transcriptional regulator, competence development regulator